jgi:hypothetical protein
VEKKQRSVGFYRSISPEQQNALRKFLNKRVLVETHELGASTGEGDRIMVSKAEGILKSVNGKGITLTDCTIEHNEYVKEEGSIVAFTKKTFPFRLSDAGIARIIAEKRRVY